MPAHQLELPWPTPAAAPPAVIRPARRVFVNRDLKLAHCEWIGFDMDYTLAIYHQEAMDRLSIDATVGKLVQRGYPEWLLSLDYPLDFPIRGLLIDKQHGNVLKMNRFKLVRKGYHGLRELDRAELRALYYDRKIQHKTQRFHWIDTLYGLSEVCTYAAVVDAYSARKQRVSYDALFADIRVCIDEAHRDGTVASAVTNDLPRFIARDAELATSLHKLRSAGKKLFVLTNSRWAYTKTLLSYLLDGQLPDYPSFQQYFDAVIVAAKKPAFFQEKNPLMEHGEHGSLRPATPPLERGRVYEGGNLAELQAALGVPGQEVLYVGDHIYGDILRSKKDSTWRTAMIIQELEAEIGAHEGCRSELDTMLELYDRRDELEDALRHHQARTKELVKQHGPDAGGHAGQDLARLKRVISSVRRELRETESAATDLRRDVDVRFHRYWGPLLKEGGELSLFGAQVDEYACVYTSRVSNLLRYSPQQYFRSPHNRMHHEL